MSDDNTNKLLTNAHINFLMKYLRNACQSLTFYEPTRPTTLFFMISGLDMLSALNKISTEEKSHICDWIYTQQVEPRPGLENDIEELKKCGFYGSRTLIFKGGKEQNVSEYNVGNLAMTYSCLCTLVILGDDLSRLNKVTTLKAVKYLQNKNGSFLSSIICGENDMRFIYCAVVICYILNDFSYINISKIVDFIVQSTHYDGGIALEPGLESHGGSSFCGIAALSLLGQLQSAFTSNQVKRLTRWLLLRQDKGFQGRPHKEVDTCYSFWIGATLEILGVLPLINWEANRLSILECQKNRNGGFSKYHNTTPDLLHTYFGLYGLSLMKENGLREMHPALIMSERANQHLKST